MNFNLAMCIVAVSCFFGSFAIAETSSESKSNTEGNTMTSNEIVKLPSGLAYQILKEAPAEAKSPEKGNIVIVQYTGWLDNNGKEGKKFDSSLDRNTPFSFKIGVGQVIQGWDSGVMRMKVGEKCRLYIPSNLGYGSRGAGSVIPANAALIFDVELLEVKK